LTDRDKIDGIIFSAIKADSFKQTYMLYGPSHEEKFDVAINIARTILCSESGDRPCERCKQCRLSKDGAHPDIIYFDSTDTQKQVDRIRELRADTIILPDQATHKVYIITHAQFLNKNSQNALLKVLEEPPASVVFILLCENRDAILTTIRSRCVMLSVDGKSESDEKVVECVKAFAHALGGSSEFDLLLSSEGISKLSREQVFEAIDELRLVVRDALMLKMSVDYDMNEKYKDEALRLANRSNANALSDLSDILINLTKMRNYNVASAILTGRLVAECWEALN